MNYKKFRIVSTVFLALLFNLNIQLNSIDIYGLHQPAYANSSGEKINNKSNTAISKDKKNTNTNNIDKKNSQTKKEESQNSSFVSIFLKILPITLGIVFLIYLSKYFLKFILKNKNKSSTSEIIIYEKEPETISEAVCSFVKHKIKYK